MWHGLRIERSLPARAWKKHWVGAEVLMLAMNGATAAVAAQNMRNARLAG